MSQATPTPPPPPSRFPNRPPRIIIRNPHNGSAMGSMPPTAQTGTYGTGSVAGAPYWPPYANPFAAGNFMAKGFEGFVDFTKSGMSFGEKFTFSMYNKLSKWSKKWFTHIFLLTVVALYTVGGALLFKAIESRQEEVAHINTHEAQKQFFNAIRRLAEDHEMRKYSPKEFDGKLIRTLRDHQSGVESLLNNNKTLEELAAPQKTWSFWNAMFFCSTIYTTIGK
ncbi:uncharacterized protein LOC133330802 [Musca vetustissima]|uniref:uncharacterized protein LOC133330802 n=1 Tax=Musca vetustissima TaxID=27455 RepID=UPI002AB67098|nr:uncharacterized protein LOC133330802 [Musca vetustissima]